MTAADRAASRKTYSGTRTGAGSVVAVTTMSEDGAASWRPLDPRLDLRTHSPHLEWGGGGRASAQLALAILADHLEDADLALRLHQRFKLAVVSLLPYEGWMLSEQDVQEAILEVSTAA
jgi:hypothetical protein